MNQIGDIVVSKQGRFLIVLMRTDTIIEEMEEIITTREPIIITAPIRFDKFTKEGFLVVPQYSSIQKPFVVEYYNREYLYESEIAKEIGFVSNSKVISDIANLMKDDNIDLRKIHGITRAKNICKNLLLENTRFQLELRENNPDQIYYH